MVGFTLDGFITRRYFRGVNMRNKLWVRVPNVKNCVVCSIGIQ